VSDKRLSLFVLVAVFWERPFRVYGITRRGIGASDKPATGYTVQRSVDDLLEVLDTLDLQNSLLVGTSCAGQILTMFAFLSNEADVLREVVVGDSLENRGRREMNAFTREHAGQQIGIVSLVKRSGHHSVRISRRGTNDRKAAR
jgi:pimeloyl-ACP methyl ester carboxylesterase